MLVHVTLQKKVLLFHIRLSLFSNICTFKFDLTLYRTCIYSHNVCTLYNHIGSVVYLKLSAHTVDICGYLCRYVVQLVGLLSSKEEKK